MYENGSGVPKDHSKALELYKKAAAHGDKTAIESLRKIQGR